MKVFISQPMKGKTESEIKAQRAEIESYARHKYGQDIEIIDSYFEDYNPTNGCIPLKYLAKSIELLADADVAISSRDYKHGRGCFIEYCCAFDYDIRIDEMK